MSVNQTLTYLIMTSVVVVPLSILICLQVARWRWLVEYLVLYAVVFFACLALSQLIPMRF